ncbi:MAG TPA: tetratricopeptide repeat protein [Ramlibacter sp.]|nr:tetratricopeptide repeat protein [Ramlibacter sp.]
MVLTFRHSQPPQSSIFPDADPAEVVRVARRAAMLAGSGDTAGAMRCYQLALLMDESRADLWVNYGILQARVGQLNDALESFDFALRLDPAMYMARYRLARVCFEMGRPLEAVAQFRTVTKERPGYIPAWRYLVQITWALGDHDEAQKLAREALSHAHDVEIEAMVQRIREDRAEADTGT